MIESSDRDPPVSCPPNTQTQLPAAEYEHSPQDQEVQASLSPQTPKQGGRCQQNTNFFLLLRVTYHPMGKGTTEVEARKQQPDGTWVSQNRKPRPKVLPKVEEQIVCELRSKSTSPGTAVPPGFYYAPGSNKYKVNNCQA